MEQGTQTHDQQTKDQSTQTPLQIDQDNQQTIQNQIEILNLMYPGAVKLQRFNIDENIFEIMVKSELSKPEDYYHPYVELIYFFPSHRLKFQYDDIQKVDETHLEQIIDIHKENLVELVMQLECFLNAIVTDQQIKRKYLSYTAKTDSYPALQESPLKDSPNRSIQKMDNDFKLQDFKKELENKLLQHNETQNEEIPQAVPLCRPLVSCDFSRFNQDFDIIDKIGSGGFGQVFKARNKLDGNIYAIKRILLDYNNEKLCSKTKNEAILLSRIQHPNIVRYYQAWTEEATQKDLADMNSEMYSQSSSSSSSSSSQELQQPKIEDEYEYEYEYYYEGEEADQIEINWQCDGQEEEEEQEQEISEVKHSQINKTKSLKNEPKKKQFLFIQMEYCAGDTLKSKIDQRALSSEQKRTIIRQILGALVYLHSKKYIHRDLKPQNIFLNSNLDVKLGDFGLATEMKAEIKHEKEFHQQILSRQLSNQTSFKDSQMTQGCGTLMYLAPEQEQQSHYDSKVDVFSLGIILFEMYYPFKTESERQVILMKLRTMGVLPNDFDQKVGLNELEIGQKVKALISKDPKDRPDTKQLLNEYQDKQFQQMIRSIANPNSPDYQAMIQTLFDCNQLRNSQNFFGSCLEEALQMKQESFFKDYLRNYNFLLERIQHLFKLRGASQIDLSPIIPAQNYRLIHTLQGTNEEYIYVGNSCRFLTQDGELMQYSENLVQQGIYWYQILPIKNCRRYCVGEVQQTDKKYGKHKCLSYDILSDDYRVEYIAELFSISLDVIKLYSQNMTFEIRVSHSHFLLLILNELGYGLEFIVKLKSQQKLYQNIQKYVQYSGELLKKDIIGTLYEDFNMPLDKAEKLLTYLSQKKQIYIYFDKFQKDKESSKEKYLKQIKDFGVNLSTFISHKDMLSQAIKELEQFAELILDMRELQGYKLVFEVLQENELAQYYSALTFEILEVNQISQFGIIKPAITEKNYKKQQLNQYSYIIGGNYSHYLATNKYAQGIQIYFDYQYFSKFAKFLYGKSNERFQPLENQGWFITNTQELQCAIIHQSQVKAEEFLLAQRLWEHKISAVICAQEQIKQYSGKSTIIVTLTCKKNKEKDMKLIKGSLKVMGQKYKQNEDIDYERIFDEIRELLDSLKGNSRSSKLLLKS